MEHHDDERESEMIEIRCTRENVRETVSDLFPDPTEAEQWQIDGCVTDAAEGFNNLQFPDRDGENVHITIVPDETLGEQLGIMTSDEAKAEWNRMRDTLSASQAKIPHTPEKDDAWRVLESQRATEGLEDHAARRAQIKTGMSGYYARTIDERLPTEQNEEYKRVGKLLETAMAIPSLKRAQARQELKEMVLSGDYARAVDNANTAEVGTFTDGPEERYQAVPTGITGSQLVRVFDRQRPDRALCWGTVEDMGLIVDALNAWEASQ